MPIVVLGILRFPPECMDRIRGPLKVLVSATRENDGCFAYDVAEDVFEPGLLRFSETWPSRETLEAHLKAEHIKPWRQVCAEQGLIERTFTAYAAGASWSV